MVVLLLFGSGVEEPWLDGDEITHAAADALSPFHPRSAQGLQFLDTSPPVA